MTRELTIGERIRIVRIHRAISQMQFSKLADIDHCYLSQIERGRKEPSAKMLRCLLKALEITFKTFYAIEWIPPDPRLCDQGDRK